MDIYIQPRQSGKTQRMIEESAKSGAYIVCHNIQSVAYVAARAKEMGLKIPFPLTYSEVQRGQYSSSIELLIDNAEIFIQDLVKARIRAITMSNDDTANILTIK